jgi:hypothetical protein
MVEELGRITRPPSANYQGKRKLLLVPLIQLPTLPDQIPLEGAQVIARYWEQVDVQVRAVQNALGSITHVYHENVPEGGAPGLGYLEMTAQSSLAMVRILTEAGAALETTESIEVLAETLDLQRCLMGPLMSQAVAQRLHEWFADATRRRYESIAATIDTTLGEDETGLLFINERHQVQFPSDVEVIYVAPPALDEFRRWMQNWVEQLQESRETPTEADGGASVDDGPADDAHSHDTEPPSP